MLVLVATNDLGSAPALLRDLHRDALHRDRRASRSCSPGSGSSLAGGFVADREIPHVAERVTIWLHPWTTEKVFCPLTGTMALRQDCQSYQLVKSLYSIANGGFGGTGLGKGTFTTAGGHAADPRREHRLHLLGARAGARARRRLGAAARVHGLRRARHEDRAPGRRRLLEAARRRAHASASRSRRSSIVGGILRVIPLTGITLPVRLLRRLVDRRELPARSRGCSSSPTGRTALVT